MWAALLADLLKACLPILLEALQTQANAPTVVHDATPTPETDAAVGDAIGDDIAAGVVPGQ